ncbi:hypothetical protein Lser_V15G38720 [Lactuca serriola]
MEDSSMESDLKRRHLSEVVLKKWRKERFRRTRKYESRFSETEEWRTTFSLVKTHRRRFRHESVFEKQTNVLEKQSNVIEKGSTLADRLINIKDWRTSVSLIKTQARRFRHVCDLEKRSTHVDRLSKTKENLKVTFLTIRAAMRYMDAGELSLNPKSTANPFDFIKNPDKLASMVHDSSIPQQSSLNPMSIANPSDFMLNPDKLASIVHNYDIETLQTLGGVDAIAEIVDVWMHEGVESSDLSSRQDIYGINKYCKKPSKSFLMFVWEAIHDPTLIILIVCSVVLIGMGLVTKGWLDGLGILLIILLIVTITAVSDYYIQSLQFKDDDSKKKKKISFQVTRDGCTQKVTDYELVVGDVVHLFIGDQVPADGIFISGFNFLIDKSSLTGETDPVHISEKKPFLFAGTIVQDGSATMLVTAVGVKTEWGKLMETLNKGEDKITRVLQIKVKDVSTIIEKIGWVFSMLTFFVLTVRFLVGKAMRNEFSSWSSNDAMSMLGHFTTAVTIIVATVTKGIPLALTLTLAFAMNKLRNVNARVTNPSACEAMCFCTCICTDMTGTLTTNRMFVDKIFVSGETKDARDSGGRVLSLGLSDSVSSVLLQGIFKCTGSEVVDDESGKTSILGTPTETAILQYGLDLGGDFNAIDSDIRMLKINSFNSTQKKMSVIVSLPGVRTRAFCKGAPEVVLGLCDKMIDVGGEIVPMSEENINFITDVVDEFAADGLRTLCLAYLDVEGSFGCNDDMPEGGYTLIAVFGIKDPLRPGVKEAVETCLAAGISIHMVTGDDIRRAEVIAKQCGILTDEGLAIEGSDFPIIPRLVQVMGSSSPTDKHEFVKRLKDMSEVVAVAGEGTIRAPALQESDIGFAMGIAGTKVAKGQADVILMDDDFATIVKVAKWGRAVYVNFQKFVQFQLTVNMVALMINLVSACITGTAPLTAVQLLWVNLIMGTLSALALATGPPNDGLMKRPPVKLTESFITKMMWRNIIGQSIYQMAVLFVLNFSGKPILNLHGPNATAILNTFIFNTFVFCQVFNDINSREIDDINVFRGMFSSWIFMCVMILIVVCQVTIVEFLGTFASTMPLDWQLWVLSIVVGLVSMLISVVLKCISAVKEPYDDGYEILPAGLESV